MRPVTQSRQLDAADPNGICLDQTTGGAGNLLINGALATGGVATLDVQRRVEAESAADLSGVNFTITGTDEQGRIISETIAGPNAGVSSTVLDFLTITQIAVDGAVGTNVEVGTNGVGGSIPIPIDMYLTPTNIGLSVEVTGTVNVTVQHTFDDIFTSNASAIHDWFDHPTLASETTNQDGNLAFPPRAVRLLTNSGSGTCVLNLVQAGAAA